MSWVDRGYRTGGHFDFKLQRDSITNPSSNGRRQYRTYGIGRSFAVPGGNGSRAAVRVLSAIPGRLPVYRVYVTGTEAAGWGAKKNRTKLDRTDAGTRTRADEGKKRNNKNSFPGGTFLRVNRSFHLRAFFSINFPPHRPTATHGLPPPGHRLIRYEMSAGPCPAVGISHDDNK